MHYYQAFSNKKEKENARRIFFIRLQGIDRRICSLSTNKKDVILMNRDLVLQRKLNTQNC